MLGSQKFAICYRTVFIYQIEKLYFEGYLFITSIIDS